MSDKSLWENPTWFW